MSFMMTEIIGIVSLIDVLANLPLLDLKSRRARVLDCAKYIRAFYATERPASCNLVLIS